MIQRNPFYLKDVVVWRRENPPLTIRGSRFAIVGSMLGPVAVVLVLASFFQVAPVLQASWALSALTWLAVASMLAISAGISVFTRERDLGALEIAALTPTSPWREVCGRFQGAFIPVLEAWLLAFVYVVVSPLMGADGLGNLAVSLWILSLLWLNALTALALYWSARSRSMNEALAGVIGSLLLLNATYLVVSAMFELRPGVVRGLPLNPVAFLQVGEWAANGVHEGAGCSFYGAVKPFRVWYNLLLIYLPLWTAFRYAALYLTSRLVARGVPLSLGRAPQGPSGIVPVATVPSGQEGRPTVPLGHGLTDRLLRAFDGNAFYHAYRKGFMRVYAGVSAAPGSAVAPALTVMGLIMYRALTLGHESEVTAGAGILAVAVLLASFIGACEGLVLGARALSSERDRDTWSMLVVSGMKPDALLRGKFATSFYALSGEWSITTPLWLIAAIGPHPLILLLALVQPASVALGILCGLEMASQPRYLVISVKQVVLWLAGLTGGLLLLKEEGGALLTWLLPMLDPIGMSIDLAQRDAVEGLTRFAVQAALVATAATLQWRHASRRLERVLRGE